MAILLGFIFAILAIGGFCCLYLKNKTAKICGGVAGVIFSVLFIIIPFSIKQVSTGEMAVVKVWGESQYTRAPGIHFDGWLAHKYVTYDIKTQEINQKISAYSQDAQTVDVSMSVQYRLQADKLIQITEQFGSNEALEQRIVALIDDKTKSVISGKQAMNIIETRNTLSQDIVTAIGDGLNKYYVDIVNILVTDVCFSAAFENAVEEKMISEQKQLQAEYEKQRRITEAEAQFEVAKQEALAAIEKSKGEAEALKVMQEAWDSLSSEVRQIMLQQQAIETWNGELPTTMVGTEFLMWLFGVTDDKINIEPIEPTPVE